MNALIRKEIRLILPAWALAMVLAIVPVWIFWPAAHGLLLPPPGGWIFAPYALGLMLLCLSSFGQELNHGTFSVLLAQPISRQRLWWMKVIILAVAVLLAFGAFWLSNLMRVDSILGKLNGAAWRSVFRDYPETLLRQPEFIKMLSETREVAMHQPLYMGGWILLATFAGGLWTTLFLRQVSAAFWFTLIVPSGLGLLFGKLLENFPGSVARTGLLVLMGAYAAGGFLWARRLMLEAEDAQWTGGIISLPRWRGSISEARGSVSRKYGPVRALLRKEFQSHQVNFIVAAGLLLLQVVVLGLRRLNMDYLAVHPSTAMALESFPLLWLAMPLLVGSVVIAEERKLGTLESSLCLPATRRLQFLAKFAMAMVLGVLLGGIVPSLLEGLGSLIGLRPNIVGLAVENRILSVAVFSLLVSAGLTLLSLYGSSITRSTLQALGAAVSASLIACVVIALATAPFDFDGMAPWRGPLIEFIAWPVMLSVVLLLSYRNYFHLQAGPRVWLRNGIALLLALSGVAIVTTVVYHRVWEAWLPEEPVHRFLSGYLDPKRHFEGKPKLQAAPSRTAIVLPDGRLWLRQRPLSKEWRTDTHGVPSRSATGPWRETFIGGSNWVDLAMTDLGCFALKTDGSLWDLSDVQIDDLRSEAKLKRFGPEGEWRSICAGGDVYESHFLALKSDGTLWQWEYRSPFSDPPTPGVDLHTYTTQLKQTSPTRVGTDQDWIAICDSRQVHAAVKSDGSIWRWGSIESIDKNGVWKFDRGAKEPQRWLEWNGRKPISLSLASFGIAAVCDDGTLWFGGDRLSRLLDHESALRASREMVQWDADSDWKEVGFSGWQRVVAIKRDGSLWQSDPHQMIGSERSWANPIGLASRYFGWVAAGRYGYFDEFMALSGDGSLCLWDQTYYGYPEDYAGFLLRPSRIKARRIAEMLK